MPARLMPLTLVTGPANAAKAQVVLERYRATLARDPILVVPRSADAEHYRRELAQTRASGSHALFFHRQWSSPSYGWFLGR